MSTVEATRQGHMPLTRAVTVERAHSAKQYLRDAYAGVQEAHQSADTSNILYHANDMTYTRVIASYHMQTASAAIYPEGHVGVLREQLEQLYHQERDTTDTLAASSQCKSMIHLFVDPTWYRDVLMNQITGFAPPLAPRKEYKNALRLVEPLDRSLRPLSSRAIWGANAVLWIDLFQQDAALPILWKIGDLIREGGVSFNSMMMHNMRRTLRTYLMSLAHDAEAHMAITFHEEIPEAWLQPFYVRAYVELFSAREHELVQLIHAAWIANQKV